MEEKSIFETIVDVLRKANIGFSFNEIKDIFFEKTINEQEINKEIQEGDENNELGKDI